LPVEPLQAFDLSCCKFNGMQKIFFLSVIVILVSCSGGGSAISKKLAGSDSLVITFNAPFTDSVLKTVSTDNTKAIQKLAGFMKGKTTELFKCGYDGNLQFFRNGQLILPVVFKYTEEGCRTFLYDLDNKVISTEMSNEAVDFLKSLTEGKNSY
jgi:hypothetical protein